MQLVVADLALLDAAMEGDEALGRALGGHAVAHDWQGFPDAVRRLREAVATDPGWTRWGPRLFIHQATLVGWGGFKGPPSDRHRRDRLCGRAGVAGPRARHRGGRGDAARGATRRTTWTRSSPTRSRSATRPCGCSRRPASRPQGGAAEWRFRHVRPLIDSQLPLRKREGGASTMPAMEEHLFWVVSRAAGIVALLLSSAAWASADDGRALVKGRGLDLRATHEALSLATLIAIVVHAVALLGDSYLNASVLDITVPFVSGYKEPWMSIGIVSGWALVALGVSYYFRTRIGVARWKKLHRWTALAWLAGPRALAGEGTDAGTTWFLVCTAIAVVPALVLLVVRHLPSTPVPSHIMSPTLLARRARVRQIRRTVTRLDGRGVPRPVRDDLHPDGRGQGPGARIIVTTAQLTSTRRATPRRLPVVVLGDDESLGRRRVLGRRLGVHGVVLGHGDDRAVLVCES